MKPAQTFYEGISTHRSGWIVLRNHGVVINNVTVMGASPAESCAFAVLSDYFEDDAKIARAFYKRFLCMFDSSGYEWRLSGHDIDKWIKDYLTHDVEPEEPA